MTQSDLKDALRAMVLEYGFEHVSECLQEVRYSGFNGGKPWRKIGASNRSTPAEASTGKHKTTAPEYVTKMGLPFGKHGAAVELAERFQAKAFLPTFGDIANFCQIYRIDPPASKTRANAIPRVFKFIASMEPNEIRRILDEGMFSGPSRLGPIADAIRRHGRASAAPYRAGGSAAGDDHQWSENNQRIFDAK